MRIILFLILLLPFAALAETDAELEAFLAAPPNPLDLSIMTDEGLEKTTVIGPSGGTLKLKNAAGDAFVLTFPEGALLTSTRITAIPISEATGLPEGARPISGLVLQPDGLELAATATLEITPKTPIPPESRLHWGFYEAGKDAFLHIPVQDTDSILIPIDHFSGAGISFADRINLQLDRWRQKSLEDRLSTKLAEEIRVKGAGSSDVMATALGENRRIIEAGRLAIANRSAAACDDVQAAFRTLIGFEKQIALVGASDETPLASKLALVQRLFTTCLKEAEDVCLDTGDLTALTTFAVLFQRSLALVGATESGEGFLGSYAPEIMAAMERCGRYKLTVQAKGHWIDGVGVYGDVNFKVEVPIRLKFTDGDLFSYALIGEAPATDVNITFVDYACWVLETYRQGAPMQAKLTDLTFDKDHAPKRVTLFMKGPELFAVTSCTSKKRGKKTIESPVSESTWGISHAGNRSGPGYILKTMKAGSHPKLFSYSWEGKGTAANVTSNDTTTLTLEHIGG